MHWTACKRLRHRQRTPCNCCCTALCVNYWSARQLVHTLPVLLVIANVQYLLCSGEPGVIRVAVTAFMVHKVERGFTLLLTVIAQHHLHSKSSCQKLCHITDTVLQHQDIQWHAAQVTATAATQRAKHVATSDSRLSWICHSACITWHFTGYHQVMYKTCRQVAAQRR